MTEYHARVALGEGLTRVGELRFTQTGPRQFSIFAYDPAWAKDPRAFALQPNMPFDGGPGSACFSSRLQPQHVLKLAPVVLAFKAEGKFSSFHQPNDCRARNA
jgi:hypothetical protein